jgi:general secretion pathway protein L
MATLLQIPSRFFSWWFAELTACIPVSWRSAVRGRRPLLAVRCSGDGVMLRHSGRAGWRNLGSIAVDVEAPAASRTAFARSIRGIKLGKTEVVLELPAEQVLQRTVDLPLAAAENLREVLGFEMDRHTPFKAEDVAFDYRVVSADRQTKRVLVDLTVAPRAAVEHAGRMAAALGLAPDRVSVSGIGDAPINLLASVDAAAGGGVRRRLTIVLAVAACLLLSVAVALPLEQKRKLLGAYEARLAESRAAAAEADALRTRIAQSIDRNQFLVTRRLATPMAVAILAELTERIPDDTWLVQLRLSGDQLMLSGYSPAAAGLIPTLEASDFFANLRFSAPVTSDPRVGRERFGLSAKVAAPTGR